jgi:hypothetical protein
MDSVFTCHIFLEVGKTQDLPSKIWQTLGDALNSGRVKKEINNKEGFLMQVFKRWKCINIILFISQDS